MIAPLPPRAAHASCPDQINALSTKFLFADPNVKVKMLNIYVTSFYGSGLWDVYGYDCKRFFTAWHAAIQLIFTLPFFLLLAICRVAYTWSLFLAPPLIFVNC